MLRVTSASRAKVNLPVRRVVNLLERTHGARLQQGQGVVIQSADLTPSALVKFAKDLKETLSRRGQEAEICLMKPKDGKNRIGVVPENNPLKRSLVALWEMFTERKITEKERLREQKNVVTRALREEKAPVINLKAA